jgi:hypothetical protein
VAQQLTELAALERHQSLLRPELAREQHLVEVAKQTRILRHGDAKGE